VSDTRYDSRIGWIWQVSSECVPYIRDLSPYTGSDFSSASLEWRCRMGYLGISWGEFEILHNWHKWQPFACRAILADAIREQKHEWTVITSPESASVFLGGWREAGKPKVAPPPPPPFPHHLPPLNSWISRNKHYQCRVLPLPPKVYCVFVSSASDSSWDHRSKVFRA
jgi:hypothetical protein